jgi:fructose-1,6-bisphosphatase I
MDLTNDAIITFDKHMIEQQRSHPTATGSFTWLMAGITLATRIIQSNVRRAGLIDVLGATGTHNVQGELVQKLDTIADRLIMRALGYRGNVGIIASEEQEEPVVIKDGSDGGKYIVLFDPLDGSSNIDVNVSIGTIFSVLQRLDDVPDSEGPMPHILQPGYKQLAAGYVVYGSSTVLAYTTGDGVHMFTLEPEIGAFVLTNEHIRMPDQGKTYSVNEAYLAKFPQGYQDYLGWAKGESYSLRYIGSLVADFHRTLLRGGVFMYPPTVTAPNGKLRLMYEANPLAFIAEQAGGAATDGENRILDRVPQTLHERTPLLIGSKSEVERVCSFLS